MTRSSWKTEPEQLFPNRSDATWYLGGLASFWGGMAALQLATVARVAPWLEIGLLIFPIGGLFALSVGIRRLDTNLTGRASRPWPFGYPSLRTMIEATFPSTMMAAGERLGLRGWGVGTALYLVLAIALISLLMLPATQR